MLSNLKFRASGVGALMVGNIGLTENQEQELNGLILEKSTGINANGNKIKWTENKEKKLNELTLKKENPELSETAKSFIKESVISFLTKRKKQIKSKYLEKGIAVEQDAINLLSKVDNKIYFKNDTREYDENFTGECDILEDDKIIDVKASWDIFTFFEADFKDLYYAQAQVYMHLYDRSTFELCYCLINTPQALFKHQVDKLKMEFENETKSADLNPEYVREYNNIINNCFFDELSEMPLSDEFRIKRFVCNKNEEYIKELIYRVGLAKTYANKWVEEFYSKRTFEL